MDSRNGSGQRAASIPSTIPMTQRSVTGDPRLAVLSAQSGHAAIRLDQPRPHIDRYRNEYVDSPAAAAAKLAEKTHPPSWYGGDSGAHALHAPVSCKEKAHHHTGANKLRDKTTFDTDHFLTKQPHSVLLEEDALRLKRKSGSCAIHGHKQLLPEQTWISVQPDVQKPGGIICPECGRCRCAACITPKQLPSYWLCNGNLECSAESVVDQLSCMSCVKGFLYHCTNWSADEMDKTVENPCACYGKHCCSRWALLGVLSVTCLPCLLCYWPCRGLTELCAQCYKRYHQTGCACKINARSMAETRTSISSSPVSTPAIPSRTRIPLPETITSSTDSSPVITPRTRLATPPPPLPPKPGFPRRVVGDDVNGRVHR
ncbi:protein sprouty homolog 4-like [Paramacrobiotus metropolitanus]|uniref:protein sprouty homolog 4-like n=1 Tax=Paramacrobiotus metropolitanus TaxID=2943436 RepID=UPI002445E786|nr:protein sprouty homolog 4-like [Paramacrobiotus metropolitanus]XP_055332119.1 protein sprouty homolog 4-like [Paramacrobiotus metropolitanus]XP_055332120.1 protein sprouty homolog 4-like [Paramacrobiotus metropolitanus]XP_055332121.1 protein sprouty homolog 4-like [Paramacrobiotus metropolitanus]XP_055332122.1 protein sprouty homolog 4-like [Paramacrobiotus metropolitanus]XP_055332123.1 protein sprouty homolog 4-like [Paramacrobiotus metropolitanus]XP_055332124.1 protein sprouty homolog 4-